jgi:hypothetical protein
MAGHKPSYYVWEMKIRERREPLRLVTQHPLAIGPAKQLARIGATKGVHDRAVTTSPKAKSFRIIAQYEAGTGKNITRRL